MNQQAAGSTPRIHGVDRRGRMYARIAAMHKSICQAKWMSQTANKPCTFTAANILQILLHLEESVAFLAEELLSLEAEFESWTERVEALGPRRDDG